MIVFRKRLIYWIIKEYLRKWGKAILICFGIGLIVFFAILQLSSYFLPKIPIGKNESIGVVGAYRADSLPDYITKEMSSGLTSISDNGEIKPGLSTRWKIEDDGKKYTFYIAQDAKFSDGSKVTSDSLPYNFSDVAIKKPNPSTIIFELKDNYSPFLVTVSHPIFKKGFVGTGEYKFKNINLNGSFAQSITMSLAKDSYKTKTYQFYPTSSALKTAYVLGEVSKAMGFSTIEYSNTSLANFPNTNIEKTVNYSQLVTLFYNTQDKVLSDKRLRSALSYSLPDEFSEGKRSYMPYPPSLWAYTDAYNYTEDIDRAKILFSATDTGTKSAVLKLEIKTLPRYTDTAKEIVSQWEKLGIKTDVKVVDEVPTTFQIFLGNFFVAKDPDQYTLWHSAQSNNITRYENQRIDKLLEDGRKTVDIDSRKKIYDEFQKYLTVDAPASFLYFPYEYEITRK